MHKILLICLLLFSFFEGNAQKYLLKSPDSRLSAEININQNITIQLQKNSEFLVKLSDIDLLTEKEVNDKFQIKKLTRNSVNEVIKPLIKDKSESYTNNYNELTIVFKSYRALTFRLFNEGLAYRFSTSGIDSLIILEEKLNIQFQDKEPVLIQWHCS